MGTDADHQACVRDPAIELLLRHTATLTDEWCTRRRARRRLGLGIGEIRPPARPGVKSPCTSRRRCGVGGRSCGKGEVTWRARFGDLLGESGHRTVSQNARRDRPGRVARNGGPGDTGRVADGGGSSGSRHLRALHWSLAGRSTPPAQEPDARSGVVGSTRRRRCRNAGARERPARTPRQAHRRLRSADEVIMGECRAQDVATTGLPTTCSPTISAISGTACATTCPAPPYYGSSPIERSVSVCTLNGGCFGGFPMPTASESGGRRSSRISMTAPPKGP